MRRSILLPFALLGACSTTPGLLEGGLDEAESDESESSESESESSTSTGELDSSSSDSTSTDTDSDDPCAECQVGEICVGDVESDVCTADIGFTISCVPWPDILCGDELCEPQCVEALCGPDHECVPECSGDPVDVWCGVNPFANNSCDPLVQDCPEGEKCVPIIEIGPSWDDNECVPISGNAQPGDPCVLDEEFVDDCAEGSFCWASPGETGFCQLLCEGFFECEAGMGCLVSNEGVLPICLLDCDPEAAQPCPEGESCVPAQGDVFVCALDSMP